MWRQYREQMAFYVVYIKEAHPDDEWMSGGNVAENIHVYDPKTTEARVEVAQTCALNLHIEIPMVLDGLDNRVASAYGGYPDRLYLIGRDGRVAYQGEKGPQGFDPDELGAAIQRELMPSIK
jgi:hypothetical protein